MISRQFYKLSIIALIVSASFITLSCNRKKTAQPQHDGAIEKSLADSNSGKQASNHILVGTTVLKGSDRNMEARFVFGIYLDSLTSSDCQAHGESPTPTEITGIRYMNDSILVISANIFANCGQSFLGEIEILHNNTLNLLYHEYGDFAACGCCFGLTYRMELFKKEDTELGKLKFVIINGRDKKRLPAFISN